MLTMLFIINVSLACLSSSLLKYMPKHNFFLSHVENRWRMLNGLKLDDGDDDNIFMLKSHIYFLLFEHCFFHVTRLEIFRGLCTMCKKWKWSSASDWSFVYLRFIQFSCCCCCTNTNFRKCALRKFNFLLYVLIRSRLLLPTGFYWFICFYFASWLKRTERENCGTQFCM